MVEFPHSSTAIGGNTLTFNEIAMVSEGITIDKKSLNDHLERRMPGYGPINTKSPMISGFLCYTAVIIIFRNGIFGLYP